MRTMATTIIALAYQEEGCSTATRGRKTIPLTVHAIHAPHHILSHGIPLIPLHSSCGSFFVPSHCAVWYCQWLPSGDTHYPPCPLFFHLPAIVSLFFSMHSLL